MAVKHDAALAKLVCMDLGREIRQGRLQKNGEKPKQGWRKVNADLLTMWILC